MTDGRVSTETSGSEKTVCDLSESASKASAFVATACAAASVAKSASTVTATLRPSASRRRLSVAAVNVSVIWTAVTPSSVARAVLMAASS